MAHKLTAELTPDKLTKNKIQDYGLVCFLIIE